MKETRLSLLLLALLLAYASAPAQTNAVYVWYNLAGSGSFGTNDGTGFAAQFDRPYGMAMDKTGNLYVADTADNRIAKGLSTPIPVYTWRNFAGQPGGLGDLDGPASVARFDSPLGIAADKAGNVYVGDWDNMAIRKITNGVVSTLAGEILRDNISSSEGSADGVGTAAELLLPLGVALDGAGNLYVADEGNDLIRKITSAGVVTTLAGIAQLPGTNNGVAGPGGTAQFNQPTGVAVDGAGNVYVADAHNDTIRLVVTYPSYTYVSTLAGQMGHTGTNDGSGTNALFNIPEGIAIDSTGTNLYVADTLNQTIRKVTTAGVVTTLAGLAGVTGTNDGTGSAARFNGPLGVIVDGMGNLLVADNRNHIIRKVTTAGVVTTVAGLGGVSGSADGTNGTARFDFPGGVAVDGSNNLFVADSGNDSIRKITSAGVVSTVAGQQPQPGTNDGTGAAARFLGPLGVAVDKSNTVFVADTFNYTIRKITSAGTVTTLAGQAGVTGTNDGTGGAAQFNQPYGLAVDGADNVFVADTFNHTIRKITSAGVVTTLAGMAGVEGTNNGTGIGARFAAPVAVAVDSADNVYVADRDNNNIRKVTSAGVVTILAGSTHFNGTNDGTGSAARFWHPVGVAVDANGNLYVADRENTLIRKITSAGVVTTLAGGLIESGIVDGLGAEARFTQPTGMAVDGAGNLYLADSSTIRMVTSNGLVMTIGGTAGVLGGVDGVGSSAVFSEPAGVAMDSAGNVYVADNLNNRIVVGTPGGGLTQPLLTFRRSGGSFIMSWPSPYTNFVPQQNSNLDNGAGWQTSGFGISDDGTNKSLTVPSPKGNLFFRLAH